MSIALLCIIMLVFRSIAVGLIVPVIRRQSKLSLLPIVSVPQALVFRRIMSAISFISLFGSIVAILAYYYYAFVFTTASADIVVILFVVFELITALSLSIAMRLIYYRLDNKLRD